MYKEILLPIDLNDPVTQEKAVSTAIEYAKAFGARLHAVTIVPDLGVGVVGTFFPEDYAQKAKAAAEAELRDFVKRRVPDGVVAEHAVALGTIYEEIIEYAKEIGADLIVMGSHRPELKDYLIGPNASRVVRHADCSVLVVRG
ncbi:MAG: universal stress protein [Rhodospirillales bacterium]|nr:universal stress protein [Rhodospirillales bacterium]MDH3910208.1 universal stress protein [Rhodospirillales bacterium]MDH3917280.1 universal stress protein [Rhodospirillales bacterium]MDH3966327.1 universal stress protein [Rhodospirillales bacterium]